MSALRARGTTVHIGTTAATAATDTYEEVVGAKMIGGTMGIDWSMIDVTALTDVYKQEIKGVADAGDVELGGNYIHDDNGQEALAAAAADDDTTNIYNIKFVRPDGRIVYLKARVTSFRTQAGTNTNVWEFRCKLSLTALPVEAAPA